MSGWAGSTTPARASNRTPGRLKCATAGYSEGNYRLAQALGALMARGEHTLSSAPRTIDLRGSGSPEYGAVLADPSGRRAARLRRFGFVIAVVFMVWLFGLVLAGLGLLPVSDLPLGSALGNTQQPPKLDAPVLVVQSSPAVFGPAQA